MELNEKLLLNIPIDPDSLLYLLVASGRSGAIIADILHLAYVVPAGTTTQIIARPKSGYYPLFITPFEVKSSAHDPEITAMLTMVGENVITRGPFSLSQDLSIDLMAFQILQYGFVGQYVEISCTNGTASDVIITASTQNFLVEQSIYDKIFFPILRYSYQQLKDYATRILMHGGE